MNNKKAKRRLQIGVVGSAGAEEYGFEKPDSAMYAAAEQIGRELAKADAIVINGGKGGVMEAVCRGAKLEDGITVAETSGIVRNTANKYVDIEIVTGSLSMTGPSVLVGMCDGIIALGGGAGTLQEICVAYRLEKPIVLLTGYSGWTDKLAEEAHLDERRLIPFNVAADVESAVKTILSLAAQSLKA